MELTMTECHPAWPQHPTDVIEQLAPVAFEEQVHVTELELQLNTDLLCTEGLQNESGQRSLSTCCTNQQKKRKMCPKSHEPGATRGL
jgi:hypothetical protein